MSHSTYYNYDGKGYINVGNREQILPGYCISLL